MAPDDPEKTTTPIQAANAPLTGRTVGDVLDNLVMHPGKAFAFLLLLSLAGAFVAVIVVASVRSLGVRPSSIEFGTSGPHVLLESVDKKSGAQYLLIVAPQGWQNSGIPFRQGDHVSLRAGGSISVDMYSVWLNADLRQKYEDEVAKAKGIRRDDPTETRLPEDYFTDEQKRSLLLNRPWVGPQGFDLDKFLPSFRSRRERYLIPGKPAGGLAAAVVGDSDLPVKSDAFFVGSADNFQAPRDGVLWLTVNDVQYSDPNNRSLFYNDNIGTFWVQVKVEPN
jgi:hypothetical protein